MAFVKFSVVVPTRQRDKTLFYTLKSCLNQDFDDYEIIVCDNCSSKETKEVVDSFNDPKIKYVRSDVDLPMSQNWELALSKTQGDYVIVLGDDDALLPYTLKELDRLTQNNCKVIRWERIYYSWPCLLPKEYANQLTLNVDRTFEYINSAELIKNLIEFNDGDYTKLPMFYNSAVHKDVIAELKSRTGRIFSAMTPDMYSGFAIAMINDGYLSVHAPFSINAGSSASSGAAAVFSEERLQKTKNFIALGESLGFEWDKRLPKCPSIHIALFDSYIKALKALEGKDFEFEDKIRKNMIIQIAKAVFIDSEEEKDVLIKEFKNSLSDSPELVKWFESEVADTIKLNPVADQDFSWKKGFHKNKITLDGSDFGLKDVFEVSKFCDNLLGYSQKGLNLVQK